MCPRFGKIVRDKRSKGGADALAIGTGWHGWSLDRVSGDRLTLELVAWRHRWRDVSPMDEVRRQLLQGTSFGCGH